MISSSTSVFSYHPIIKVLDSSVILLCSFSVISEYFSSLNTQ